MNFTTKGKNLLKDMGLVLFTNVLSLVTGVIAGFIIPKYMGINEYAYLMIFSFYVNYVIIFNLGFTDGIYIKFGNYNYNELPKEKFRMYFVNLFKFLLVITTLVIVVVFFAIAGNERKIIFIFIAINIIILNLTSFLNLTSQVTKRFKIYSINSILSKVLYVLISSLFLLLGLNKHLEFIILLTGINFLTLLLYIIQFKDLVFGKKEKFTANKANFIEILKIGFPTIIGNFVAILIIGISRFFVDKFFSVQDFAIYSFGVSLLNIVHIFISAMANVIFPYLARIDRSVVHTFYKKMQFVIMLIVAPCLSVYFILIFIVTNFIPKYVDALPITLILFTSIIFRGQMNAVSGNFYKVYRLQKDYTINNIVSFLASIIISALTYFVFKTIIAMAVSSTLIMLIWYLYTNYYFQKKFNISLVKISLTQILICAIMAITGLCFNWYIGLIIYIISLIGLMPLLYFSEIKELIHKKLDYFQPKSSEV